MMSLQKAATGITSGTFFLSMTSCVMMHTEFGKWAVILCHYSAKSQNGIASVSKRHC